MSESGKLQNIAFYYPGFRWTSDVWMKNMVMFFDGIALLVPESALNDSEFTNTDGAYLLDQGLLHIIKPESVVDKLATEKLASAIKHLLSTGALEPLIQSRYEAFSEISRSRLGFSGDQELAETIVSELRAHGLALKTNTRDSVYVHDGVRSLILVLLSQILRPHGATLGLDLSPATDQSYYIQALMQLLSLPKLPSAGNVVTLDLQNVGVDLSSIPIDEIISFRTEHLVEHQTYARTIRKFVREISLFPEEERNKVLQERQDELDEMAMQLRKRARHAWKRPASFALAMLGAAWTFHTGDPIGAILGTGAALVAGENPEPETGTYTYVFEANKMFPSA